MTSLEAFLETYCSHRSKEKLHFTSRVLHSQHGQEKPWGYIPQSAGHILTMLPFSIIHWLHRKPPGKEDSGVKYSCIFLFYYATSSSSCRSPVSLVHRLNDRKCQTLQIPIPSRQIETNPELHSAGNKRLNPWTQPRPPHRPHLLPLVRIVIRQ